MEYITTKEASEKWGISLRRVQAQCKYGIIPGATRAQREWLIPADAIRPSGYHHKTAELEEPKDVVINPFLMGTLYHTPGTVHQVIEAHDEQFAAFARAQLAYYQGDIEEAYRLLCDVECGKSFEERVGFLSLQGVCAMYRGDVLMWKTTRNQMADITCASEKEREKRDFWLAMYDSALYDNAAFPQWFRKGKLSVLPREYAPFARQYYVKYLIIHAHDKLRTGAIKDNNTIEYLLGSLPLVCEPLIAETESDGAVIAEIHLRLLCAIAYYCLGNNAEAVLHIDRAIVLALPDRLYAPLAEHRSPLELLLDERLKLANEVAYNDVRRLAERLLKGWTVLHNATLDRDYSLELTAREREASRLATYGLSNHEISVRLNVSNRAVKEYIQKALFKTGAKNRSELARYI